MTEKFIKIPDHLSTFLTKSTSLGKIKPRRKISMNLQLASQLSHEVPVHLSVMQKKACHHQTWDGDFERVKITNNLRNKLWTPLKHEKYIVSEICLMKYALT